MITKEDYTNFNEDKKYLSAKLLTYFAEHSLIFVGYSATDPNIRSVLYDVDRMIHANFNLIPNIYILEWNSEITSESYPARDRVLAVGNDRNIRIKSITASSFEWVFKAFASGGTLDKVNMKLLRSLMARTVELVRKDIPTKKVEVDFQTLEHQLTSGEGFATLMGITALGDPSKVNATYPYTITQVAEQLGHTHWTSAHELMGLLKEQSGFDMKASDNKYHISMRTGKAKGSIANKYSQAAIDILANVMNKDDYVLAAD